MITAILTADQVTALDERYRAIAAGNGPNNTDDSGAEEQPEWAEPSTLASSA